ACTAGECGASRWRGGTWRRSMNLMKIVVPAALALGLVMTGSASAQNRHGSGDRGGHDRGGQQAVPRAEAQHGGGEWHGGGGPHGGGGQWHGGGGGWNGSRSYGWGYRPSYRPYY